MAGSAAARVMVAFAMKKLAVFVVAVLLAAGGGSWWFLGAQADTPAQRTHTVAVGSVEDTVSAVGTLQALNYVDVGTQVSGQLRTILVKIGDTVEKGQLLAQLDPTVYEARVAADQAQILNLRAQMTERQVQQALAEKQFERQRRLLADRATSQEAYDSADAERKILAAQITGLEAQLKQTESTLKGDQANLSYTKIYAPMSGVVVDITARQGQTLNANQQAPIILRIAELSTMTVRTQVSEADVPRLKVGMAAYFTTLGRPDRRREGTLRQVLPTPEVVNNVVLFASLFDVANPDLDLLPQMSAHVFFVAGQAKDVPVVPMAALRPVPRKPGLYTARVLENGQPAERRVEIGVTNRVLGEVRSGLAPGDEVILDGVQPAGGPNGGPGGNRRNGPPAGGARL
ncbi:efflux RND transporter periplasmic adaptor subunit [Azospirillum sp. SYSU D00513]|uniref:efflux RND transporter periplasmic adaptor subunit n=1 Tax=Azospirillum sp. SYSU D00513 TaxID=2812561 RepID=UPI001A96C995|nr:efflux RND transporter periplasmic adaptor subunit [Azospirillum sp. SYSU D00513]